MTVETLIEALGCYNKDYNVQIIQESSDCGIIFINKKD